MDQTKIGTYLRELRLQNNLTQEQLAEKFNTTNRSVSRWENGKNLPDISLLVELADFYNADIRDILDGEKKHSPTDTDTKDVASKIADYTDAEHSRLLIWIRRISLMGVVIMAAVLALQTFTYEPGIPSFICYVLCLIAFMVMCVLSLHANGILAKISKNKAFVLGCKVLVISLTVTVILFVMRFLLVLAIVLVFESTPSNTLQGMEHYDKSYYLTNYGGDLDTGMFIFPDSTDKMLESTFESSLDTGLFDTDGYIILRARYSEEDYLAEKERLAGIECTITLNDESVTQQIRYDETSYALPAYVTSDGFCDVYEYALPDDGNTTVTYILLCYPDPEEPGAYAEYLKTDLSQYNSEDSLKQFTIYAHSFDNGNSWYEYSDMQN